MNKNDKKRLYWLINNYLNGNLSSSFFCDEYCYCYDLGLDLNTLTQSERLAFEDLDSVVNRFSAFKSDLAQYPGVYYDEALLREKVLKTWNYLMQKQLELGVMCCFCNEKINSKASDLCDVTISPNWDEKPYNQPPQNFWCHRECFRNVLHNNIQQHLLLSMLNENE